MCERRPATAEHCRDDKASNLDAVPGSQSFAPQVVGEADTCGANQFP
jgi:hypothetical protein